METRKTQFNPHALVLNPFSQFERGSSFSQYFEAKLLIEMLEKLRRN
jgi:hypothetical protein